MVDGTVPALRRPDSGRGRRTALHVALVLGALVMLYPLLWMVGASLKNENQIFADLAPWPRHPTASNYLHGWGAQGPTFTTYFLNSFLIAVGAVVGNVLACSLAAYAFGRLRFRLRRLWFAIMLGSIMLPAHALIIPQYSLYYRLGWVNSDLPLIVPKFLATDAFFVFMMVQFIRSLPRELDEAAALDGCGPARIFWRIIFPLLRPALVTTVIFTFIWTYNDFFTQLIYLTLPNSETVPVALRNFMDSSGGQSSYGQMLAMSVVSLVPTFIVFLVSQRRIVEGIATTGLRG